MPDDVRLFMFECGVLDCHVENIKMNQGLGEPYSIPVPSLLITHPRGNVVIDGGNAAGSRPTRTGTGPGGSSTCTSRR